MHFDQISRKYLCPMKTVVIFRAAVSGRNFKSPTSKKYVKT